MDSIAVETHFPRCYEKHVTNFSNQRFTDLMGIRVILDCCERIGRSKGGRKVLVAVGCSLVNISKLK